MNERKDFDSEERIRRNTKHGKKRRRSDLMKRRIIIAVVAAAAVFLIIWGIVSLAGAVGKKDNRTKAEDGTILAEIDFSEVRHISFTVLSLNNSEERMSVEQLQAGLQQLYDQGYCLIDIYELAYKDTDGNYSKKNKILFPEGKKPLIISQRDVCYPYGASELGVAEKLVIDGDTVKAQSSLTGKAVNGSYDLVPVVEDFIKKHPDFSYNGARGVLGVTGYCGVLGYRTSSYLAQEANNPFAGYGLANIETERASAKSVADKLKELGWHFACSGFGSQISYGSEFSIMSSDVLSWKNEVEPVVGASDIVIFPKMTDIGSWAAYKEDNQKFSLLKENGFSWFLLGENSTPDLLQIRSNYVRETYYEVNTPADFSALISSMVPVQTVPEEAAGNTDVQEQAAA